MKDPILKFAVDSIYGKIGIAVEAKSDPTDPVSFDLIPSDSHPNDSFTVRFSLNWRTATAEFIPGKFATPLIEQMGSAGSDGKSALIAFASALEARKTHLTFRVNGIDLSPFDSTGWPMNWRRIELQARSALQVIDMDDLAQMQQLITDLVVPIFGMAVALIGVEETEVSNEGEVEGNAIQILATRYERKRINREACIQLKGLRCMACGFDFGIFYGPLGAGFIEVHHITPVSQIGPDYQIDISKDLVPLCANCHAMVHRANPPMPILRLSQLIQERKGE